MSKEVIRIWESFQQIADEVGVKYAALWAAAKAERVYAGFLWVPQAA